MRTILIALPLLAACAQDSNLKRVTDGYGAEGAEIEVSPPRIDFGALAAGEVVTETFTVQNVGADESILAVTGITLGGDAGGFSIVTPAEDLAFTLPGGAAVDIEVAFTPYGASEVAEAIVASDDEDERRVTVELLGEGLVPELEIAPDPYDFGTAYVGCDKDHDLTLTNVGTDTLTVSSIAHSGGQFVLTDPNALPLDLAPGEATTVNVAFVPAEEGAVTGELTVTSNEPRGTRTAEQTAEGAYAGEYEDVFEVPTDPPTDILFFVDQSCSMDDDARALGSNFSSFISSLSAYTSDWQVMVVNDDDGCNNSGILTTRTSGYESRFTTAVSAGGGIWTEAGLTVAAEAVDKTDGGECNAGFMRSGALLHIVMVSDEPEQSLRNWSYYVNSVIAKKGDASLVKFSAVAGDYPSGCSSSGNSADAGVGYYEAVMDTGGVFLSICSNWSTSVDALADASVEVADYELSRTPVPETIAVFVNGTRRSDWIYDSGSNSIVFDASGIPAEGDTVRVTYAGLASCD